MKTVLEKFVKVVNRVTEEELLQEASASTVNGDEDPILPCQLFLGKSRYFSDEKKGKRLAEEVPFKPGSQQWQEKLLEP